EVTIMDWNRIEGNWKQAQGKIKEKWGKLTDDDLTMVNGRREQLEGIIQQRYGMAKDQLRKEVGTWLKSQPSLNLSARSSTLSEETTTRSLSSELSQLFSRERLIMRKQYPC